ncbi:MAG: carboxylesterase family protein [Blastomonas sp.]
MFRTILKRTLAVQITALLGIPGLVKAGETVPPPLTPVVGTAEGAIQGVKNDGIDAFLGIAYAAAPIGERRFMPPEPPRPWQGIWDATALGAPCMQMNYLEREYRDPVFTRQMQLLFPTLTEKKTDNEDCLFLNVWTPAAGDGGSRPVMLWIHGGGYAYGSGGWPAYDGRNLAARGDVVVVTVNHRLNAFGYLPLAEKFGDAYAQSGNLGQLDLIRALQWVQDNIASFGGDPGNVTIMGESGGGSKVSHLLATPSARGLFHKAIIQSGAGIEAADPVEMQMLSDELLADLGVTSEEELRAVPAEQLLDSASAIVARVHKGYNSPNFRPVLDGVVMPRHPFTPDAPEMARDIPVMIGWNKDEMTFFNASQPWFGKLDEAGFERLVTAFGPHGKALAKAYRTANPGYSLSHIANRAMAASFIDRTYQLADRKADQGGAPVYVYRLDWETPVNHGDLKSPHMLEIPLMFDNVEQGRPFVGPGTEPQVIADMMSDAWIAFARSGTPATGRLPKWEAYDSGNRMVMLFDLKPRMASDPEGIIREALATAK